MTQVGQRSVATCSTGLYVALISAPRRYHGLCPCQHSHAVLTSSLRCAGVRQGEEVRSESASTNRELKRRFYHVQRAKDAAIIGQLPPPAHSLLQPV